MGNVIFLTFVAVAVTALWYRKALMSVLGFSGADFVKITSHNVTLLDGESLNSNTSFVKITPVYTKEFYRISDTDKPFRKVEGLDDFCVIQIPLWAFKNPLIASESVHAGIVESATVTSFVKNVRDDDIITVTMKVNGVYKDDIVGHLTYTEYKEANYDTFTAFNMLHFGHLFQQKLKNVTGTEQ